MNALISLCHFCEGHGPSIIFCTQAFHTAPQNPQEDQGAFGGSSLRDLSLSGSQECSFTSAQRLNPDSNTVEKAGAKSDDNNEELKNTSKLNENTQAVPTSPTSPTSKSHDSCETCRAFAPSHRGFVSTDQEAWVRYISTQHPTHPQVYLTLRQACVRSLSCEECPGREGPIFFGDENRGHVLSHTFIIKDSQGRGFQRRYSIIIIMTDKIFLLNSWPFLVKNMRKIIDDIQEKAAKTYEAEQSKCPQRAHRLNHSTMMTSRNFRQHRGANIPARSLVELTNDKQIFRKLHQAFVWILKVGGNRLTEKLLEGPPTEDSIIDIEKQEETEEGFVKLFKVVVDEKTDVSQQTSSEEEPGPLVSNLRHLIKALGYARFHTLAHHVVIGNQVIIRSIYQGLVKSVINTLKLLLPKGCCRAIYYSQTYEDSWRCNLLGLPPDVLLPQHAELYVVLNIDQLPSTPRDENGLEVGQPAEEEMLGAQGGVIVLALNGDETELDRYAYMVESPASLPDKGPSVLSKMEFALLNDNLADSVVEQCLVCLKEEWMNKVKVLFKFTKAGGNRSEEDTRRLLAMVGAHPEDKVVLKFWMTGLSVQYRNHMLSSAISQAVAS